MRLRLRGLSRPEDRFEAWISQRHQERVLEASATSIGPCPDDAFFKSLAKRSKQIQLSDARVDHAANCPICMSRLLALRREHRAQRLRLIKGQTFCRRLTFRLAQNPRGPPWGMVGLSALLVTDTKDRADQVHSIVTPPNN